MPSGHSPLHGVITGSAGLRIVLRGARVPRGDRDLVVVEVAPVSLPGTAPQEARLPNGELWRRLWLLPDRLVVDFVGIAVVEVRDGDGSIVFDRILAPDVEEHFLLDHLLPLLLARRGDIVVHGAVLSRNDRAVLLVGESGAGKSTFTAFAGGCGWTIGGDDCAVVRLSAPVRVEPTYPTVRLTDEAVALLGLSPSEGSPVAGKRRLIDEGRRFRQEPAPLALVARLHPVQSAQPARFRRVEGAAAHAVLLTSTIHAELRGNLLRDVFDRLAQVVEGAVVGELDVPRGRDGLTSAEALLRREANL